MNYFMSRDWLCDRLRLSRRQSRTLVRSGYGPCVSANAVLSLVNSSRHNIPEPFASVPSDIMKADELALEPELAESGITDRMLLTLTRREQPANRPPFLRLNKQTTRFVKSLFLAWLASRAASASKTGRSRFI